MPEDTIQPRDNTTLLYAAVFLALAALVLGILSFMKKSKEGPQGERGETGQKGATGEEGKKGEKGDMADDATYRYIVDLDAKLLDTSGNTAQTASNTLSVLAPENPGLTRESMIMYNANDVGTLDVTFTKNQIIVNGALTLHKLALNTTDHITKTTPNNIESLDFRLFDSLFLPSQTVFTDKIATEYPWMRTRENIVTFLSTAVPKVTSWANTRPSDTNADNVVNHVGTASRATTGSTWVLFNMSGGNTLDTNLNGDLTKDETFYIDFKVEYEFPITV